MEALPRRHARPALDRPRRPRRVRALPGRAGRPAGRPGLGRRPARLRLRPRGPRQRLLRAAPTAPTCAGTATTPATTPATWPATSRAARRSSSTSAPACCTGSTRSRPTSNRSRSRSGCPGARVGAAAEPSPRSMPSLEQAETVSVDATGRASVVNVRGTVQWLTHRDGPVRVAGRHGRACAPGCRGYAGDASAIWVTDADGDDALELSDGDATRRIAGGQLGRVLELTVAPDGDAGRGRHPRRPGADRRAHRRRDPRARHRRQRRRHRAGLLARLGLAGLVARAPRRTALDPAGRRSTRARCTTRRRNASSTPRRASRLDGRYLAFLSARTFDPVYDAHNFELSFTVGVRPYLIPLAADAPSPFDPEADGRPVAPPDDKGDAGRRRSTVRVDVDGLADRTVVVPVAGRAAHRPARGQGRPAVADPPDHRRDRRRAAGRRRAAASGPVALGPGHPAQQQAGRAARLVPGLRRRHPDRRPRRRQAAGRPGRPRGQAVPGRRRSVRAGRGRPGPRAGARRPGGAVAADDDRDLAADARPLLDRGHGRRRLGRRARPATCRWSTRSPRATTCPKCCGR